LVLLQVRIVGVDPGSGVVRCAIYDDRSKFLTKDGIAEGKSQSEPGDPVEFEFLVAAGEPVVVSVFQDINSNEKLDRGVLGIPTEPWGFSGKPFGFGPPSWDACAIVPSAGGDPAVIVLLGAVHRPGGQ
jgi:uncharacterized protein (DUF2141 family)